MADPLQKKYTLVQAGNGDYFAVTNDEAEAEPVRELATAFGIGRATAYGYLAGGRSGQTGT